MIFQTKALQKNQDKHFVFNNAFPKKRAVSGIVWKKNGNARQATDNNMAHPQFMLNNYGYTKHTHSEYVILIALPQ
jgi:hypothetical protein